VVHDVPSGVPVRNLDHKDLAIVSGNGAAKGHALVRGPFCLEQPHRRRPC
jgi:hypothetical protein